MWMMGEGNGRSPHIFVNHHRTKNLTVSKTCCYTVRMNVDKQIAYWQNSGREDWDVALELVASKRTRHGLFFAHLAIEKTFKALVCWETKTFPPKTHNLLVLADKTNLALSDEQKQFIARFDRYQLEGRYPDMLAPVPDIETAVQELDAAKDFLKWLAKKF